MSQPFSLSMDFAGKILTLSAGKLAPQATGAVLVSLGETQVLVTTTMNSKVEKETDFFPLTVDFQEKFYATGKIKGSRFVKREGKPSDHAILTGRLIDRPLRPLFPKRMRNETQIVATVLSADLQVDPDTLSIIGASASILLGGLPFEGPAAAVRVGLIQDSEGKEQLVLNPNYEQVSKGRLDIVVAGTEKAVNMIEAGGNDVSEETIFAALDLAHKHIKQICAFQKEFLQHFEIQPKKIIEDLINPEAEKTVFAYLTDKKIIALYGLEKPALEQKLRELEQEVIVNFKNQLEEKDPEKQWKALHLKESVSLRLKEYMRAKILKEEKRLDNRKLDEIRPLSCEVDLFPRTHGSALFQRGYTQAITLTTLGSPGDAQLIDEMDNDEEKRYIHHYNFPPFSTGETGRIGTGRREIGHGNLSERSLVAVLPSKEEFPYTIRVVTEILSSDGSTSMASVCGSTLSLMAAGVPIKAPVAGIAMGLITDDRGDYKVLTDIQGQEDFLGDMDFKVAGTRAGINALQMDMKIKGIGLEVLKNAIHQAGKARFFILDKIAIVLPEPRKELSPYAPMIITMRIDPEKIREVIGRGGETIQRITKETGARIDLEDDGLVMITATSAESGRKAEAIIKRIVYIPKVGDCFAAKVVRILNFGAFAEYAPGKDGLIHISKICKERVNKVEDYLKIGQVVNVRIQEIDEMGRVNLTMVGIKQDES